VRNLDISKFKPLVFNGQNYAIWVVKMEFFLKSSTLWDHVQRKIVLNPLPTDPTLAQIKLREEVLARKAKALSCLHCVVTEELFMRIITCTTAKEDWDKLAAEFRGDDM